MVKRRDLLGGGILGGLFGVLGVDRAEAREVAAAQRQSDQDFREIVDALDKLRRQFSDDRAFHEIAPIRDTQRIFLRANQKMPEFLDVGAGHWFNIYDWHVRWQQPLNLGRDAQGHYTILFMGTTVILRAEMQDSYMSTPYDVK